MPLNQDRQQIVIDSSISAVFRAVHLTCLVKSRGGEGRVSSENVPQTRKILRLFCHTVKCIFLPHSSIHCIMHIQIVYLTDHCVSAGVRELSEYNKIMYSSSCFSLFLQQVFVGPTCVIRWNTIFC